VGTIGYFRLIKIILFDINWTTRNLKQFFTILNIFLINTIIIFFFSDILNNFLLESNLFLYANLLKYI
jgi:hypothetical protein